MEVYATIFFVACTLVLLLEVSIGDARTIKEVIITGISPGMNLNRVLRDYGSRGKKFSSKLEFDGYSNDVNYIPRDEDVSNINRLENEESEIISNIDSEIFATSGDMGKALQQVWESFSMKMKTISDRVNKVEKQTSDILNRLAVVDCSTLPRGSQSGIYTLHLDHRGTHSVKSFCDMETEGGGWTVVLNRIPHEIVERATNFNRTFRDYKVGFGTPDADFWVGLENIHLWTSFRDYQLRINLEDFKGDTAFAHYEKFYLQDEKNGYKLHVSGYRGNAGDSLTNLDNPDNFTADGMMFSTHDEDRDTSHEISCSQYWDIGGWWFNRCSWANLMGPYRLPESGDGIGINWHKWRNKQYIKAATMMIRPSPQEP